MGYLADGFKEHPATYLISDLFGCHDRSRFNVHVYSYGGRGQNPCSIKIEQQCDRFADLSGCDDMEIARAIHADQCDILVELKGYTLGSRLGICACRPAPVQVRYLGMPGTTGADFFDYLITDRIVTPPEFAPWYSETFAYLPDCYQINCQPPSGSRPTITREAAGLPQSDFIFCCFCTSYKIDWQVFRTWANILERVPGSRLWLLKDSDEFAANIRHAAELCAIDTKRIIFADRVTHADHLARLGCADLALDTVVVSGAATTSDALRSALPVVGVLGRHFASRMTASILQSIGLHHLVGRDLREYEEIAVGLSRNPRELGKLKSVLQGPVLQKTLFNVPRFVGHLESLFMKMWENEKAGKQHASSEILS